MPTLSLTDIDLYYEVDGNGPPLLLIAGMCSDSASWAPLIPLLASHFTVIRPDNRSTGRTTPLDAPLSVTTYAQDCIALIEHLGHEKSHILGHSLGGMIGLQLAHSAPMRVASLTLAAAAPLRLARNVSLFKSLVAIRESDASPDLWLRTFFPWLFATSVFEDPAAIDGAVAASLAYPYAQSAAAMRHQLDALDQYAPPATPPDLPLQALLAEDDLILPVELALPSLGAVPIHRIAGAGHSIHWDAPQAVADHLLAFVRQHPI
jgi:aminoacrylate hydrolase